MLGEIARVEKDLAPLTAEARRAARIVRTAGSPSARAVARFELSVAQIRRRPLRARLAQLCRERDGLVLETIARDAWLEAQSDEATAWHNERYTEVES